MTPRSPWAARGDRRAHRHAERGLEPRQVDADPAGLGLVVHVEHEHRRHLELPELQRQQQRAPQVLRVGDLHHDRAVLPAHRAHEVPGDLLVLAQRQQRVEPRRVDHLGAGAGEPSPVDLDRRPRVVGDRGAQTGERVEQRALADVRVAEEDDPLRARRVRRRLAHPLFGGLGHHRPRHRDPACAHIETGFQLRCQRIADGVVAGQVLLPTSNTTKRTHGAQRTNTQETREARLAGSAGAKAARAPTAQAAARGVAAGRLAAVISRPTTNTVSAPTTLYQRKATLVSRDTRKTAAMPANSP